MFGRSAAVPSNSKKQLIARSPSHSHPHLLPLDAIPSTSTQKAIVAMPFKRSRGRRDVLYSRSADCCAVKFVIGPPILKIGSKPTAHNEATLRRYRDISFVEKAMDVGAKQKAIRRDMLASSLI
jgi:hypothetical protein